MFGSPKKFKKLENDLYEQNGVPIIISNNKKKSLSKSELIINFDFIEEDIWLNMLRDRNDCTHIYNENMARDLADKIIKIYIPAFNRIDKEFSNIYINML